MTVHIKNFKSVSAAVSVAAGATVTFVNDDQEPHTVTATNKSFDSGVVFVRPDGTRDQATSEFVRRGAASIVYLALSEPVRTIDLEDSAGHIVGIVHPVEEAERE